MSGKKIEKEERRNNKKKDWANRKQIGRYRFKPNHFNNYYVNETKTSVKRKRLPERIKR